MKKYILKYISVGKGVFLMDEHNTNQNYNQDFNQNTNSNGNSDNSFNGNFNGNFNMNPNGSQNNSNYNPNGKKPKHKLSFTTKVALGISGALAVGIIGGAIWQFSDMASEIRSGSDTSLEEQLQKDTYVNDTPLEDTVVLSDISLDNSVTKVVEDNMAAIVSITCQIESQVTNIFGQTYNEIQEGAGSGIIIGEDDTFYYISTNNHVVAGASAINVTFCDDTDVKATLKGADSTGDLAVIAVKKKNVEESTRNAIKIAELGTSDSVKVGDTVVAIGNALGLGQSCTVGVVSALDREVTIENVKMTLIQTDAAINGGNSGGALLNLDGEVIGINSAKLVEDAIEGMCFAIPISNAQTILDELMNGEEVPEGKEGYLGLSGISVTQEESSQLNIPVGVYVREVPEGGAAYKAGVLAGDVITKLNGVGVATIDSLQQRANSYKAGTEVTLTVQRYKDGVYEELELKLTLMSSADFGDLKYSEDTVSNNGSDSNGGDSSEQSPSDPSQEYSEDELRDFYDYFREYFGN